MTDEHWIQWIAVEEPDRTQRVILPPGGEPKAMFQLAGDRYQVFGYCNLHGLWKG
jgi:superoxide reductase